MSGVSTIDLAAMNTLVTELDQVKHNVQTEASGCRGPMDQVWADTEVLGKVDLVRGFINEHMPDLQRRLALAQQIEASTPGFQSAVQFSDAELPTISYQEAEANARALAKAIKDGDALDDDMLTLLREGRNDPYFAHELASQISPEQLADFTLDASSGLDSKRSLSPEDGEQGLADYKALIQGLGQTFGLATRGTGDLALSDDYASQWSDIITQTTSEDLNPGDGATLNTPGRASGLAAVLAEGRFDGEFIKQVSTDILSAELGQEKGFWERRAYDTLGYRGAYGADGGYMFDPLAAAMKAMSRDPEAAMYWAGGQSGYNYLEDIEVDGETIQTDHLFKYLIQDRRWPNDGGQGMTEMLQAAMTPFEEGLPDAQIAMGGYAHDVSLAFQQEIEARADDHGPISTFGHLLLDLGGLVPLVGEPIDVANGLWYAAEGDVLNAGLSFAGAVPVLGWAAVGGKWVKRTRLLTKADIADLAKVGDDLPQLTSSSLAVSDEAAEALGKAFGDADIPADAMFMLRGRKGGWNRELNNPLPDKTYVVDGKFMFKTDDQGRVIDARGRLDQQGWDRNSYQQGKAGGADRAPDDVGSHIFGRQFGGPGEGINLQAVNKTVNGNGVGNYGALEKKWADLVNGNPPATINVRYVPRFKGTSQRPTSFTVVWTKNGVEQRPQRFSNP